MVSNTNYIDQNANLKCRPYFQQFINAGKPVTCQNEKVILLYRLWGKKKSTTIFNSDFALKLLINEIV